MTNRILLMPFSIVAVIFLIGCSGDSDVDSASAAKPTKCGLTQIDSDNKGFWFSCGLSEIDDHAIKLAEGVDFPESQLCEVSFTADGTPDQFRCSENPTPLDSYMASGVELTGAWSCSERDSRFKIVFESSGVFTEVRPASEESSSIWARVPTQVGGDWSFGDKTNRVRITPSSVSNELTKAAGADFSEAPGYLKRRQEWTIKTLTHSSLEATRSDLDSTSSYLYPVKCSPLSNNIAASNDDRAWN